MPRQGLHRVAVDGRRVQQPALPLVAVLHPRQLTQVGAHPLHEPGEALDFIEQGRVLQVPENLLAVAHGAGIVQLAEQNLRDEITLLTITRDRRHDLIQVQIPREGVILVLLAGARGRRRLGEQQAGEVTTPGGETPACGRREGAPPSGRSGRAALLLLAGESPASGG